MFKSKRLRVKRW